MLSRTLGLETVSSRILVNVLAMMLVVTACETADSSTPNLDLTDDPMVTSEDLREPTHEEIDTHWEHVRADFDELGEEIPADLEIVRWVSMDEAMILTAECLTEAGFPSRTIDRAQLESSPGPGQEDQYLVTHATCRAQYPINPASAWDPMSDDVLAAAYEYMVDELMPCLENRGQPQPDPPTKETFIEQAGLTGDSITDFISLPMDGERLEEELNELLGACPVNFFPPLELRNG